MVTPVGGEGDEVRGAMAGAVLLFLIGLALVAIPSCADRRVSVDAVRCWMPNATLSTAVTRFVPPDPPPRSRAPSLSPSNVAADPESRFVAQPDAAFLWSPGLDFAPVEIELRYPDRSLSNATFTVGVMLREQPATAATLVAVGSAQFDVPGATVVPNGVLPIPSFPCSASWGIRATSSGAYTGLLWVTLTAPDEPSREPKRAVVELMVTISDPLWTTISTVTGYGLSGSVLVGALAYIRARLRRRAEQSVPKYWSMPVRRDDRDS